MPRSGGTCDRIVRQSGRSSAREIEHMKRDTLAPAKVQATDDDLLAPLLRAPRAAPIAAAPAALVGRLLALGDGGTTPLVTFPGQLQPGAVPARCVVDLRPAHVGADVLLVFDGGDLARPLVTGVVRGGTGWPLDEQPGRVKVDVDGERLTIAATHELVLRCGKAALTLRSDGRIELRGADILTDATGANRIRGGSVQLN
nr:DUF6484 domain-containing protein [Rhizobacter sp. SG703]